MFYNIMHCDFAAVSLSSSVILYFLFCMFLPVWLFPFSVQMIKDAAPEFGMSGSEAEDEREEPKIEGERDPDFNQVTWSNLQQNLHHIKAAVCKLWEFKHLKVSCTNLMKLVLVHCGIILDDRKNMVPKYFSAVSYAWH